MTIFILFFLLGSLSQTFGHGESSIKYGIWSIITSGFSGAIYYPISWLNQVGNGLVLGPSPDSSWSFRFIGPDFPQPEVVCQDDEHALCSGCSDKACRNDFFTNYTFIPGEPTLADEMYNCGSDCSESQLENLKGQKNPWSSPGTAPVFGEGCGVNGANPHGCECHEDGPSNYCYGDDERPYGSCCGDVCILTL